VGLVEENEPIGFADRARLQLIGLARPAYARFPLPVECAAKALRLYEAIRLAPVATWRRKDDKV
jgi:hypothetical protein